MGRLETNTFANLFSAAWSAALGILCIPLYVNLMGVEAFGLVGLFITLQSVFVVLDLGIGATLCRELARLTAEAAAPRTQRDLVFTLQAVYWLIALLVGGTIFALAPALTRHWVRAQSLSAETVETCIGMMGAAIALRFPFGFYQGGLLGLQRQVLFNMLAAALATLRAAATLLPLWLVKPAPEMFFAAQIAAGAFSTGAAALMLWLCLPAHAGGRCLFRPELVRRVWRFGSAYAVNSIANLGLLQGGRITLSTLLPLEMFGYYTLAHGIADGMYAVILSVVAAVFPQFAGLTARRDEAELAAVYHRSSQLMSVLLAPIFVVAALFAREMLFMWTGDPMVVENAHLVLTLLICGMLLHGLIQLPYYLQVAHSWWRIILQTNLLLLLAIIPLNILMARAYGGPGVALVWVLLNVCYILTLPLVHRRFLKGQQTRWFFEDVLMPLGGALCVGAAARWLMPPHLSRIEVLAYLSAAGLLTLAGAAAFASRFRSHMLALLRRTTEPFVT
ncbi:MAG: oligosaccharide flippase family protein [Acidobacteria bacterium]|nr:oligosaccharide flippase family protein [Acidobacteriota bacterium]